MIPRFLLTFLAGVVAGFLLHVYLTGGFPRAGETTVAAVSAAALAPAPPAPAPSPSPPVREADPETGDMLRRFLAETPVQLDTVTRERDEAFEELRRLSKEFLLSYGTMDQAGATVGGLLRRIMEFESLAEADVDSEAHRALVKDMVSLVAMSDAVRELDADPAEASLYQTAVLQQVGMLSDASAARVRAALEQAYRNAGAQQINYASRPAEGVEEWTARRAPVYEETYLRILSGLAPAENQAIAEFLDANGFMGWKLVDPFDPAVFVHPQEYTGREEEK